MIQSCSTIATLMSFGLNKEGSIFVCRTMFRHSDSLKNNYMMMTDTFLTGIMTPPLFVRNKKFSTSLLSSMDSQTAINDVTKHA